MNNASTIIEIITTVIGAWFTAQFTFGLVTVLLGNVIVEHVETGVFRNTKNPLLKLFTYIVLFLFGLAPFIYKKLSKFSWLMRRLLMFVITLVVGILFMIIYYIIKAALYAVFL